MNHEDTTHPIDDSASLTRATLTRAYVLCPYLKDTPSTPKRVVRPPELKLAEAESLASTLGVEIIASQAMQLRERRPSTLLGKGKLADMLELVQSLRIELVIVDYSLSPIQQRNLEKAWSCKVIDRTAMIIEIFAARARTSEGKLQVELAELEYRRSRLVRAWTHLERQRGGLGNIGGPGETQIEADRRMIGNDIIKIKRELEEVRRTRQLHRASRKKVPYPIVALVGYTNAGKSTLFNRLTGASVLAEDKLFATLDPTMRKITLPSKRQVILSDTVGFISDLPTELVVAFRATLEEVLEADLLLHVRDATDPALEAQYHDVEKVLRSLKIDDKLKEDTIEVLNKVDALPPEEHPIPAHNQALVSAISGDGCADLLEQIDAHFHKDTLTREILLQHNEGKKLAWLHAHGEVLSRTDDEEGMRLTVRMSALLFAQFLSK
jgi:GTP-binding protein HflX